MARPRSDIEPRIVHAARERFLHEGVDGASLRTIASNARRSVFLPISGVFVALGLLFFALPKVTAYVFGGICAWLAVGAGREAFRRRADR